MSETLARPILPDDSYNGAASQRGGGAESEVTYYGRPMLKAPHWDHTVTIYLFLGGIMGGSAILAMLADGKTGNERKLARNAKYASFLLSALAPGVLVTHLGRPERFHHMMRVVKVKSPMSLGVWGLIAFSTLAAPNAMAQAARDGLLPRWIAYLGPRFLNLPQALLGGFIMGYTGVLISATAIPLWAKGKYHIPAMSVCSGLAGACALQSLLLVRSHAPDTITRLEKLEALASAAEAAVILDFKRYSAQFGKPMFEGSRGGKFRTGTLLAGIAAPLVLNAAALFKKPANQKKHSVFKTLLASGLTLVGGYILRETLIEGGKLSADDPTVASRQPE
jgi:formate-dependent nitrite reductase membrane component NrfD